MTAYRLVAVVALGILSGDTYAAPSVATPLAPGNPSVASNTGNGFSPNPGIVNLQRAALKNAELAESAIREAKALEEGLAGLKAGAMKTEAKVKNLLISYGHEELVESMRHKGKDLTELHEKAKNFLSEHKAKLIELMGLGKKGEGSIRVSHRNLQELLGYAKDLDETSKEVSTHAQKIQQYSSSSRNAKTDISPLPLNLGRFFETHPRVKIFSGYVGSFDPRIQVDKQVSPESPEGSGTIIPHAAKPAAPAVESNEAESDVGGGDE
jgi:hypothetical protein